MTRVVLVRHGETEWNLSGRYQGQSDIELTQNGIKQAENLAKRFPLEKIDAVYASDLKRAEKTAQIVADRFDLPVRTDKDFRELAFGGWEGLTYEEMRGRYPKEADYFFTKPDILTFPDGESFEIAGERFVAKLKEVVALNEGKNIVVVAHGGVLRAAISILLHIPLRYLWSLRQDNTAVNILRFDGEYVMIELLNSTEHLKPVRSSECGERS